MSVNLFSLDVREIVERALTSDNYGWGFTSVSNIRYGKMFLLLVLMMREVLVWDRWVKFLRLYDELSD